MRILVLGGTVFLGRALARLAMAAGHDVTCAARGLAGVPVDGARLVRVDRDQPDGLAPLDGLAVDAVIDVARRPSHVRRAVDALAGRVAHFTFVSSGSAYADPSTPGQRADTAKLLPPALPDVDDPVEHYGACKVACERIVLDGFGPDRSFICRAGLIVGPEDPTSRFSYWVRRLAAGGPILAPGGPDDLVQLIDVDDLATWIVDVAATGRTGRFDGMGAPMSRAAFFAGIAGGLDTAGSGQVRGAGGPGAAGGGAAGGGGPELVYVPQEFLAAHEIQPWDGPRSLPIWLPVPEYAGFLTRDVAASLAAGLRPRPLAETARRTYAWLLAQGRSGGAAGRPAGLTPTEEAEALSAFRA